jgi:hypothetical protein
MRETLPSAHRLRHGSESRLIKGVKLTYDGDWRLSRARSRLVTRVVDGAITCRRSFDDQPQNRKRALGRYSLMAVNPTSEPCRLRRSSQPTGATILTGGFPPTATSTAAIGNDRLTSTAAVRCAHDGLANASNRPKAGLHDRRFEGAGTARKRT